MRLGEFVTLRRRRLDMVQADLAESVGITRSYLSLVENGRKDPSLGLLRALAGVLRVPTVVLVSCEEPVPENVPPELEVALLRLRDSCLEAP